MSARDIVETVEDGLENQREVSRDYDWNELCDTIESLAYEQNFDSLTEAAEYVEDNLTDQKLKHCYGGNLEKAARSYVLDGPNSLGGSSSPNSPTGAL